MLSSGKLLIMFPGIYFCDLTCLKTVAKIRPIDPSKYKFIIFIVKLSKTLGGSLNMVAWYASTYKKTIKRGDFCHRLVMLVGSRDLQKGVFSPKMGSCLTEDTPVIPIKGVFW